MFLGFKLAEINLYLKNSTMMQFIMPHQCLTDLFQCFPVRFIYQLFANAPFLYPLKTSENFTVFWYFQGVEKGCIGYKWVK